MGKKSPFPPKKPATNSGIFSNSGAGQKLDPVKLPKKSVEVRKEAMAHNMRKSV